MIKKQKLVLEEKWMEGYYMWVYEGDGIGNCWCELW